MARSKPSPTPFLLFALSLALFCAAQLAGATDHIVGGHLGWNPNINYTLWSNNQTFLAGDLISFRYQKNVYNVFEVNETGYDNCTLDSAVGNWSSGKDFIPLNKPGMYYFICGNGMCFNGMKVAVHVEPLPSPRAAPTASDSHSASSEKSAAGRQATAAWVMVGAAMAAVGGAAWAGVAWI